MDKTKKKLKKSPLKKTYYCEIYFSTYFSLEKRMESIKMKA